MYPREWREIHRIQALIEWGGMKRGKGRRGKIDSQGTIYCSLGDKAVLEILV